MEFAHAHGFEEGGGGPNCLFGCRDNHYAFSFLWIVGNSLFIELAKQFIIDTPDDGDTSSQAFYDWCKDSKGDLQFESIVFLARVLSAITLARKANERWLERGQA